MPGKEDYLTSEKYYSKVWDWDRPGNIRDWITRLNAIRRENPALHEYDNLKFYDAWNDRILFYGKIARKPSEGGRSNFVLVAVTLAPLQPQACSRVLPSVDVGLPELEAVDQFGR